MASIKIEDFDARKHPNPMSNIDDEQSRRHLRAPALVPYKVCLVEVCGFQFFFHSLVQIDLCLEYYRCRHQPSSRLPVYTEYLGSDHGRMQRWFEKLPAYLLESSKRERVIPALERARLEYQRHACADTGTAKPELFTR